MDCRGVDVGVIHEATGGKVGKGTWLNFNILPYGSHVQVLEWEGRMCDVKALCMLSLAMLFFVLCR